METSEKKSNQPLINTIGGVILAIVVIIAGIIGFSVNSSKSDPCTGKDPLNGNTLNGYKDKDTGKCITLDGKVLE